MNRLRFLSTVGALLALSLLASASACSAAPAQNSSPGAGGVAAPESPAAAPAPGDSFSGEAAQATDRMVIYTASVRLVVTDVEQVLVGISQLARDMGGYVVSSESQDRNGDRYGRVSVRVPAERLDEALEQMKGMAERVERSAINSEDVTEEFVDQDARLRNLRATEEQYLQLMKNAYTVEDTIRVQQSLTQVREEIERTQGRLQYLERSSEMALINVEMSTAIGAKPIDPIGWDAQETLLGALQGLTAVGLFLASIAIWVLVFVPVWGPALLFVRWWRRRRRASPPATPAPTAG